MSIHPELKILGYSEAAMYLGAAPAGAVVGIVSIHGAREFGIDADIPYRLDLAFDDIEVPIPGDDLSQLRTRARKKWAGQNGLNEIAPTAADAQSIVDFARDIQPVQGMVLCHCGGGMSRAPAAALICLATWRGPGTEAECMQEIRNLRRGAVPHAGLIRFADSVLAKNGALIAAIGLGGETRSTQPPGSMLDI